MRRLSATHLWIGGTAGLMIRWWPLSRWWIALRIRGWYLGFMPFHPYFNTWAAYQVPRCVVCGIWAYNREQLADGRTLCLGAECRRLAGAP